VTRLSLDTFLTPSFSLCETAQTLAGHRHTFTLSILFSFSAWLTLLHLSLLSLCGWTSSSLSTALTPFSLLFFLGLDPLSKAGPSLFAALLNPHLFLDTFLFFSVAFTAHTPSLRSFSAAVAAHPHTPSLSLFCTPSPPSLCYTHPPSLSTAHPPLLSAAHPPLSLFAAHPPHPLSPLSVYCTPHPSCYTPSTLALSTARTHTLENFVFKGEIPQNRKKGRSYLRPLVMMSEMQDYSNVRVCSTDVRNVGL